MICLSTSGQCRGCNGAFLRLLGMAGPLHGLHTLNVIREGEGEVSAWLASRRNPTPGQADIWHPLALDDGRHFEVCQRPLSAEGEQASLWIFRDVTRLRQLEEATASQQEQLVGLLEALATARDEANRATEAKSQFLANMSHELRTPLHGVIGMTRLAREHTPAGPSREYLDKATRSAQRLLRLVNEVLDFSKAERGQMSLEHIPFDLGDTLEQALSTVELQAHDKGLQLSSEVCSPLLCGSAMVLGDPLRLHQVLINLLGNAVKFTEQGFVRLEVSLQETVESTPRIRFAVLDSGIGLSKAQQAHIFDEFAQGDGSTTRKYGGTGLGLSISRRLCQLMGSELQVSSAPNEGSCFEFSLPLEWAPNQGGTDRSTAPLEAAPILLVEDDIIIQQLTLALLTGWGARVDTASNGQEALARLEEAGRPPYQAILLDLQMPEMDGFALAQALAPLRETTGIKLMALSAHLGPEELQRCEAVGIADQMLKPFEPEELLKRLLSLLKHDGSQAHEPTGPRQPGHQAPFNIVGLDSLSGLRRAGGQLDLYVRLLQRFLLEYESAPASFAKLHHQASWATLERKAHTLKGLAATLGASELAEAASRLQEMAGTAQPQPIGLALSQVSALLDALIPPLKIALANIALKLLEPQGVNPRNPSESSL